MIFDFYPKVYKKWEEEGKLEDKFLAAMAHELNHMARYPYYIQTDINRYYDF